MKRNQLKSPTSAQASHHGESGQASMENNNFTASILRSRDLLMPSVTSFPAEYPFSTALGLLALILIGSQVSFKTTGNKRFDAPIVGSSSALWARWEFFRNAPKLLEYGYSKV